MTDTTHFLLTARVISVICDILIVFFLIAIYRQIFCFHPFTASLLSIAGAVLYVSNYCVYQASGLAWNHDAVTLAVVISFWLFITTDFKGKAGPWRLFIIGGILTFATCMRITTALILLVFFIFILAKSTGNLKQRCRTALPYVFGTFIALIWPFWTITQSPKAFFINIYRIPSLNSKLLHEAGLSYGKLELTIDSITRPDYLLLIIIAIYLYCICLYYRKKIANFDITNLALAVLLPILFFIIAFIPLTIWVQYFAMPVPFLIISLAFPLRYLWQSGRIHFKSACLLITVCALIGVSENPAVLKRIPNLFKTDNWTALQVHKISEQIAQKIDKSKPVLTLAPLYVLEGGCEIYPQLSAGPFVYRVADLMNDGELKTTNTIGPKTLNELIEKSPPSAVLVGTETEYFKHLEQSLKTAAGPGWHKKSFENGLTLYYKQQVLDIPLI